MTSCWLPNLDQADSLCATKINKSASSSQQAFPVGSSKWPPPQRSRGRGWPPSCGTDSRNTGKINKWISPAIGPAWVAPGLGIPCPEIPPCLWSLGFCLATGSFFPIPGCKWPQLSVADLWEEATTRRPRRLSQPGMTAMGTLGLGTRKPPGSMGYSTILGEAPQRDPREI